MVASPGLGYCRERGTANAFAPDMLAVCIDGAELVHVLEDETECPTTIWQQSSESWFSAILGAAPSPERGRATQRFGRRGRRLRFGEMATIVGEIFKVFAS
jgi:hypothetical protein